MVSKKFFKKRPDKVRNSHFFYAFLIIVLGVIAVVMSFVIPVFVTSAFSLIGAGITYLFFAQHMPDENKNRIQDV